MENNQLTGIESQDAASQLEFINKLIDDKLKESQKTPVFENRDAASAPPEPQPIQLNLFGQPMTFGSMEELAAKTEAAILAAQQQGQQQAKPAEKTEQKPHTFEETQFTELLKKDGGTPEAIQYALQYSPYGKNLENTIQQLSEKLNRTEMALTGYAVREQLPEIRGVSQGDVQKILGIITNTGGDPKNPATWDMALTYAKAKGYIQAPAEPARNSVSTPPYMGASSSVDNNALVALSSKFRTLTRDQQREALAKMSGGN